MLRVLEVVVSRIDIALAWNAQKICLPLRCHHINDVGAVGMHLTDAAFGKAFDSEAGQRSAGLRYTLRASSTFSMAARVMS